MIEAQFSVLAETVEKNAAGQGELVRSVSELTGAVAMLRQAASTTQDSLKTFIADNDSGRVKIAEMIGDVIEKKTGGWLRWAVISLIFSAPNWVPRALEIMQHGYHG